MVVCSVAIFFYSPPLFKGTVIAKEGLCLLLCWVCSCGFLWFSCGCVELVFVVLVVGFSKNYKCGTTSILICVAFVCL